MLNNKKIKIFLALFTGCTLMTAGYTANQESAVMEVMAAGLLTPEVPAAAPVYLGHSAVTATEETIKLAEQEKKKAEEAAAREAEAKAQAEAAAQAEREQAEAQAQAAAQASGSQQELELMASIIFCEAGNQSYEGQVAVGAVIMNRVRSGSYPDSIESVVYQSGQFGPAVTGWLDKVVASSGYTDSAMQAAKDALAGSNPIGDCLYFDQGNHGMQIGDHFFH